MPEFSNDLLLMDYGAFTLQAPKSWKKINGQNGDKQKGNIALDQANTVEFNLGPAVQDILDYQKIEITDITITTVEDEDGTQISTESLDISQIIESDIVFDMINGIAAKILVPQKPGKGAVGIFFDSLGATGNKFSLFGFNLKPENETAFLDALKTLKFNNSR